MSAAPEYIRLSAIERACSDVWRDQHEKVYPNQVSIAIQAAARDNVEAETPDPKISFWEWKTPESEITSDYLSERIHPDLEELRVAIFGQKRPPYKTPTEAVAWLENRSHLPYPLTDKENGTFDRLVEKMTRSFFFVERKTKTVPYLRAGDPWVHRVPVGDGQLLRLADVTSRLASATGFHQAALVGCVLQGTKPRLSRGTVTKSPNWGDTTGWRQSVAIRLKVADFTREELLGLYRRLKSGLPKRLKRLTESDLDLYKARKIVDAVTPKSKRKGPEYRRKIRELWGNKMAREPRAVEQALRRLDKKLAVRGLK